MRLKDKVAIVTGAGSGIGEAIAELFAREGAAVVVAEISPPRGQAVADRLNQSAGRATFVKCNVAQESDVAELEKSAIAAFGRIDILVNNAGVNFVKPFEQVEAADWDRVMNTDLRGAFLCSRMAVRQMLKSGAGSIVNIASVHTLACVPGASAYDAAKWGLLGLTKAMAVEFASRHIRINAVSPGLIDTQIWKDLQAAAKDKQAVIDYWKNNIPMGRVGTPNEVAQIAAFLASNDAAYVTGANFVVDGGMTSLLTSNQPYQSDTLDGKVSL